MDKATSLAAVIKKEFGIEANIRKGPIGLFDVYVDGWTVYSNRAQGGRLPQAAEIIAGIRDYQRRLTLPGEGTSLDKKASDGEANSGTQCSCR